MKSVLLRSCQEIETQIKWHVDKILLTQDEDGTISSYIEYVDGKLERRRDIPRQAMATMALSFAQTLVPSVSIEQSIAQSLRYIQDIAEQESSSSKLYTYLYLILSCAYAKHDATEYLEVLQKDLLNELFEHPIAVGLYLRIAQLLPDKLPLVAYMVEVQRYTLSVLPRQHRFFDLADTVVWATNDDFHLAQKEYAFLLQHKTSDNWFEYEPGKRATASVVGKMFEVISFANQNTRLVENIYNRLMQQCFHGELALGSFGKYHEHILSEQNTLRVDDVHSHILVGLCYYFQHLSK